MYAATKKPASATRVVGLVMVVVINGVVGFALATGIGGQIITTLTQTEVVIIDTPVIEEEEPPPPPPPDLDLPPPPPQVVLPEFIFDAPPPPTAITQVEQVQQPRPAAVAPPPPAPRPVTPAQPPRPNVNQMAEMMQQYYPPASLRAREEGVVRISMCVDDRGRITDVKLVQTSGIPRLDDATVRNFHRVRMQTPAKDSSGANIAWCNPPYELDVQWQLPRR